MSHDIAIRIPFPNPVLTKIIGRPTFRTCKTLRTEIYDNARCVADDYGPNGLLGVVMPEARYRVHNNDEPFVPPENPGPHAVAATRAADNNIAERNYVIQRHRWLLYTTMKKNLCSQMLQAIEPAHLRALKNRELGFSHLEPIDILNFIMSKYGKVNFSDLQENTRILQSDWNLSEPLATLWERAEECREVAEAGGEPISDAALVNEVALVIGRTGAFTSVLDKWRVRPREELIWNDFLADIEFHDDDRLAQLTAKSRGYSSANAAVAESNANSIAAAATAPGTSSTIAPRRVGGITIPRDPQAGLTFYYCSTHGFVLDPTHNSITCFAKGDTHKENASFGERMGGSTRVATIRPPRKRNGNTNVTTSETEAAKS